MIIYKVTNLVNGMVYIGKTKRSLEARWKQHCHDSNKKFFCYKFQNAIKEFGAENFRIEQIDCAATEEEANAKEVYWIQFHNAIENGYNVSPGGKAGGSRKKVMAVESGLVFNTMVEAGKYYGLSHSMIPQVVDKPHLTAGGQHWISV